MVAIVRGKPCYMGLIDFIDAYIDHQKEVMRNKCNYDLERALKRQEIVAGLIAMVSILDAVITTIKNSKNKADAKENIISKYAAISEHVCENCGAVDVPMLNIGGWFSPYCKTCYDKVNHDGRFKPFDDAMDSELQMPNVLKWRRYDKNGWQNFEMDIKETVDKIREKAKREDRYFYES